MRLVIPLALAFLLFIPDAISQDRRPIKVLTWNIYMRPHSITFDGQFRRAKAIGELLKTEDYDIILFQEAFGKTSRNKLRKALGGEFPFEIEPKNRKKTVNSGLWILSKHE
ncbi:MAG: endonuclease/exonuclease/phosphatase family protein, partial [Flavobacteriales bacterium]